MIQLPSFRIAASAAIIVLFAASPGAAQTAPTPQFPSEPPGEGHQISPRLTAVETLWAGNTFGAHIGRMPTRQISQDSMASEMAVRTQGGLGALAAGPDGTVYVVGRADSRRTGIFKDGMLIGNMTFVGNAIFEDWAIAVDDKYVYVAYSIRAISEAKPNAAGGKEYPATGDTWFCVGRWTHGGGWAPFPGGDGLFGNIKVINTNGGRISALASNGKQLFVADPAGKRIVALDVETMQPATGAAGPLVAEMDRPGRMAFDRDGNLWVARVPKPLTEPLNLKVNAGGPVVGEFVLDRYDGRYSYKPTGFSGPVTGIPNAAPAEVYATIAQADYGYHVFQNLVPGEPYTIRFHLIEDSATKAGENVFNVLQDGRDPVLKDVDIFTLAGGKLKPFVLDFPVRANASGQISLRSQAKDKAKGRVKIAGYEVLGPRLVGRDFSRELVSFTPALKPRSEKFPLAEGVEAVDIAFNPAGELLVADNGKDTDIKIFNLASPQKILRTIGQKGGVLAGPIPGTWAPDRFTFLTGLAVGSDGKVFVANDAGPADVDIVGAHLVCFFPDGTVDWTVEGYIFMDDPGWDRGPDGKGESKLGMAQRLFEVDLDAPAGTWRTLAFDMDRFRYPNDLRIQDHAAFYNCGVQFRYLGGKRYKFVQGSRNQYPVSVYRFEEGSEVAIPFIIYNLNRTESARFKDSPPQEFLWRDASGDGRQQANEYTVRSFLYPNSNSKDVPNPNGVSIDEKGGMWFVHEKLIRYLPARIGPGGLTYDFNDTKSWSAPEAFKNGSVGRVYYDAASDTLFLTGTDPNPAPPHTTIAEGKESPEGRVGGNLLARFDGWLASVPPEAKPSQLLSAKKPAWTSPIAFDSTRVNSRHTAVDLPVDMAAEGEYVFVAYATLGKVRVYRADTGAFVGLMEFGPSVRLPKMDGSGDQTLNFVEYGTLDSAGPLRIMKRKNGKYALVFHDNYVFRATILQWDPAAKTAPIAVSRLTARQDIAKPASSISLEWPAPAGAVSYTVERMSAKNQWKQIAKDVRVPSFTDSALAPETLYFYRIRAASAAGDRSDSSNVALAQTGGRPSINFSFTGGGSPLPGTDVAGQLPRGNWNNLPGANSSAPVALKDERGTATSSTVAWTAPAEGVDPRMEKGTGDEALVRGFIGSKRDEAPVTITLKGIPFKKYTAYIYCAVPETGSPGQTEIKVGGKAFSVSHRPGSWFLKNYFQVRHAGAGNLLVVPGLTDSSLVLSAAPGTQSLFGRLGARGVLAAINGVQIVEDPIP